MHDFFSIRGMYLPFYFSRYIYFFFHQFIIFNNLKKVDNIFKKEFVLFPINVRRVHWSLVVLEPLKQPMELNYYDSMNGDGMQHLKVFLSVFQKISTILFYF
jgi:hypothetical protein